MRTLSVFGATMFATCIPLLMAKELDYRRYSSLFCCFGVSLVRC